MKPTLTNIENRIGALENRRPASPETIVIRVPHTGDRETQRAALLAQARARGARNVVILPEMQTVAQWTQTAREYQAA